MTNANLQLKEEEEDNLLIHLDCIKHFQAKKKKTVLNI